MKLTQNIKKYLEVPIEFISVLIFKMTHHKGKRSTFKTMVFMLAICYLLFQPLFIIRAALASSFVGYMLNNFTNTVMDTVAEVSP